MLIVEPAAIERVRGASRVTVLTGAGISAESGIPTFRDKQTGLWARYDALELATLDAFERDPALVWGWYEWRREAVLRAAPNPGHRALATMAAQVPSFTLITQNVDDLHERAGSEGVVHLHGELSRPYCQACGHPYQHPASLPDVTEHGASIEPPRCPRCGDYIRPGVVWFGEPLPRRAWSAALEATQRCDVFLLCGTSSLVQPAASLLEVARDAGALTIQINPNATDADTVASLTLRGPGGLVLPQLVRTTWPSAL